MAVTDIAVGSAQAVKVWSKVLMIEVLKKTWYSRFSGKDPENVIQILPELEKGAGDQVKFDLLQDEQGYGVNKNATLEGNETVVAYFQDSALIEQKRLGKAWYRMSQQRTLHDLRKDSMRNLRDAWARILDKYMFAHLVGTAGTDSTLDSDITDHAGSALVAADAAHLIDHSGSAFDPDFIDEARWKAETADPPIQKLNVEGMEAYVMFVHPYQAMSLQKDAAFRSAMENAAPRDLKRNPIFSGALGMWNDVILHAAHYLPSSATNVRHAVLCGKQAGVVAFGNALDKLDREKYGHDFIFSWIERDSTDYGNTKGVSASAIFDVKRTIFNSESFGVMRVDSTDAAPA